MDIIDTIQEEVDKIVADQYSEDPCPPFYLVSIYQDKILLTIDHMGQAFSEKIFPEGDMTYGISGLEDLISSLYARTM